MKNFLNKSVLVITKQSQLLTINANYTECRHKTILHTTPANRQVTRRRHRNQQFYYKGDQSYNNTSSYGAVVPVRARDAVVPLEAPVACPSTTQLPVTWEETFSKGTGVVEILENAVRGWVIEGVQGYCCGGVVGCWGRVVKHAGLREVVAADVSRFLVAG